MGYDWGVYKNMQLKTLHNTIREKLAGYDCVLAFETASDYLGTNKMAYRPSLDVYSLKELNIDGVNCTVLDSYDNLEVIDRVGLRCTSERQTIIDLLRYDRDPQVTIEAIADWYFNHNESYNGLDIPEDIQELFKSYAEDAIHYFDD